MVNVTEAVFYSKEKPELLAGIINALLGTEVENLSANIVLDEKEVDNGTTLDTVKATLPTSLSGVTSKGIPYSYSVSWGSTTTPTYDKDTAGSYVLEGTISNLPIFVTNTGSKKVQVTIKIKAA